MAFLHKDLTKEKWQEKSFFYQMANVGAEIGRAINWRQKDSGASRAAFERGLELLDLTIADKKNHDSRLVELCRVKEGLLDYFYSDNIYKSTDKNWNDYFYSFGYASALNR